MNNHKLIDNTQREQYEYHIDGTVPKIEYMKSRNGEIYLTHTEVPASLREQGIGSSLVEDALADIEKQNLKLIPLCPFVAKHIRNNPEWKRILMKGFNVE